MLLSLKIPVSLESRPIEYDELSRQAAEEYTTTATEATSSSSSSSTTAADAVVVSSDVRMGGGGLRKEEGKKKERKGGHLSKKLMQLRVSGAKEGDEFRQAEPCPGHSGEPNKASQIYLTNYAGQWSFYLFYSLPASSSSLLQNLLTALKSLVIILSGPLIKTVFSPL